MITQSRAANAIGGKTARACDNCLRHRARWFCASDDAFLCQGCDSSVHWANHVASRHERVRLGPSASKLKSSVALDHATLPSWHQGLTRRARTPRSHVKSSMIERTKRKENDVSVLVPELSSHEDTSFLEYEEQVLFQVPVYDPFEYELCNIGVENIFETKRANNTADGLEHGSVACIGDELEPFSSFLPPEMDLPNLAAGVESLPENGTKDKRMKVEEGENKEDFMPSQIGSPAINMSMKVLEENWDSSEITPMIDQLEVEEKVVTITDDEKMGKDHKEEIQRNVFLRLNYEGIITAWGSQGSPWTTGRRPEYDPDDCLTDFTGSCPADVHGHANGRSGSDEGREAKVTRYREKRRTRLFSKKIRYEVRKLNAEKRPRIKGRFVKSTSFILPPTGSRP